MKCERCQNQEASVHITQHVNGQKTEQNLCQSCAQAGGLGSALGGVYSPFLSSGFFGGSIFNPTGGIPAFGGAAAGTSRELVCPNCGTTFDAFRKSGLFGCSQCYETFREKLDPVLRRVQGGTRHIGRTACKTEESKEQAVLKARLAELRKRQASSVEREDYEEAARLRDEIRTVDARLCELTGQAPGGSPGGSGGSGSVGGGPGGAGTDKPDGGPGKEASR